MNLGRYSTLVFSIFVFCLGALGQGNDAATRFAAEQELARKVIEAHGGDKFRDMSSLFVSGTVDITASNLPQAIPATFVTVFAGERYRFELNNPFQPLKQVFDGERTTSTAPGGFSLPPVNRLGLTLLPNLGKVGFIVTSLPEDKRKRTGFRVTSPEGYFTDFIIDPKTNRVRSYEATYTVDGRSVTTTVEIDRLKEVEGVFVPERYVQRFDLAQFTVYANFRARDIRVNSKLDDDVFAAVN